MICPICDEYYETEGRDLPEGFCEHCAEEMDNSELYNILRKHFNGVVVAVIIN